MSWDDEDFEVPTVDKEKPVTDRWEGEDVEEDTKENWFDEPDEKGPEKAEVRPVPKKKSLKATLAEKEMRKKEDAAAKRLEKEQIALDPVAEKLRQQRLQEESDLMVAKDTFGVTGDEGGKIDNFHPSTSEEFTQFAKLLQEKISTYETSLHYPAFLETLFRSLTLSLECDDLRKLGTTLNTLANEKAKAQKAKTKKKSKKATLATVRANDFEDYGDLGPEYDDFM